MTHANSPRRLDGLVAREPSAPSGPRLPGARSLGGPLAAVPGAEGLSALTVTRKRFGLSDGFVVHHKGAGPDVVGDDGRFAELHAQVVPVMIVAASPEERDRILRELARHVEGVVSERALEPRVMQVGELRVDPEGHRVSVSGRSVQLRALEFRLLVLLMERRDCVQSRATLLGEVWHSSAKNRTRTVDTHVKRLRDKLGSAGRFLQSVRGVGYRFSETVAASDPYVRRDGAGRTLPRAVPPMLETG